MTYDKERLDKENKDVLKRNIEQSQELIDANEREAQTRGNSDPNITRPPKDDPRHTDQSVLPDQENVPAGGTTGGQMNTGGGFKSSR